MFIFQNHPLGIYRFHRYDDTNPFAPLQTINPGHTLFDWTASGPLFPMTIFILGVDPCIAPVSHPCINGLLSSSLCIYRSLCAKPAPMKRIRFVINRI